MAVLSSTTRGASQDRTHMEASGFSTKNVLVTQCVCYEMRKVENGENVDCITRQMPETLTFEIFNVIEPGHSVPSREELKKICDDAVKRSKPRALPKAGSKSPHDPNTAKEHEQGTDQEETEFNLYKGM